MEETDAGCAAVDAVAADDRRDAVAVCTAALRDLRSVLFSCANGELAAFAGELAELRAMAGAGLVAVTAEAAERGVIDASQYASTSAWVGDVAWHSSRESATVAKVAALIRQAEYAPLADAVSECDVDLGSAVAVGEQFAKLAPDLVDEARPIVLEQMLNVAAEHGPRAVRRLKDEILARYGTDGEFEEQQERRRRHIELSAGRQTEAGLWDYQLTVDTEGRAVLEGAIGPGSAPKPQPDGGPRDSRPVGRRRGEALIDALRRSVAATEHVPTSPKAILMLTMNYDDLAARLQARTRGELLGEPLADGAGVGAGTVLGSRASGDLLSPKTVRRLACDAGIIPAVLGGGGEILDQGRMQRLFTTAQVRGLWLRDRHCTFPGCDIPAAWCDAHHLVHWIDGGETDIANGALLCARHHTIVHRDQLAGYVTAQGAPPGDIDIDLRGQSRRQRPRQEKQPSREQTDNPSAAAVPKNPFGVPSVLRWPKVEAALTIPRPTPAVTWDLRPGSYCACAPGSATERLTA